jgi:hypothetical protein
MCDSAEKSACRKFHRIGNDKHPRVRESTLTVSRQTVELPRACKLPRYRFEEVGRINTVESVWESNAGRPDSAQSVGKVGGNYAKKTQKSAFLRRELPDTLSALRTVRLGGSQSANHSQSRIVSSAAIGAR